MAALEWITIEGFKSVKRIEQLPLKQINVLIGANGSGKSNFLEVFSFVNAIKSGNLRRYILKAGGADRILHFGSKETQILKIHISFKDNVNQYKIELEPDVFDSMFLLPSQETAFSQGSTYSQSETQDRVVKYVQDHLDQWRLYHFHDTTPMSPIKKTADVNDNRLLRPDGSNLASFLYFLRERHEQSYELICHTIRLAAPFFEDFLLEPQKLNPDKILLEWKYQGSDAYFNASSLSDGTLRLMALATLLLQPPELRPGVIIIDEPELGLHPSAITLLASLVQQAASDTQIILATQSSLLIDYFNPEDILVADHLEGATELKRLEPESLESWLTDYSLGQLWEKNELGGCPAPESRSVQTP